MLRKISNKKTFTIAAVLVAGLLVVGAAKTYARGGWGFGGDQADRLTRTLDLSDEQETKIRKIVREADTKRDEIADKYRASNKAERDEMEKLRTTTEGSISSVLNDAQKTKFKELTDSREDFRGKRDFGGRGNCGEGRGPGNCGDGPGGWNCGNGPGNCGNWNRGGK